MMYRFRDNSTGRFVSAREVFAAREESVKVWHNIRKSSSLIPEEILLGDLSVFANWHPDYNCEVMYT